MNSMRRGISLMEVLVSIGIVAIGLISVLSLLPVGGYQAMRANVEERKAALGMNLVHDMKTRGYFKMPDPVQYPNLLSTPAPTAADISKAKHLHPWITASGAPFVTTVGTDWRAYTVPPLVIDPLSVAANGAVADVFPFNAIAGAPSMKRLSLRSAATFNGTVYTHIPALAANVSMAADDVIATRPDDATLPATSEYSYVDSNNNGQVDANERLQRQFAGEFSWLAMLMPTENEPDHISAVAGRQMILSVAIFNRRDLSNTQEGMVAVQLDSEGIGGGEVTIQSSGPNAESTLSIAQAGEWILLCRYEPIPIEGGNYSAMPVFAWERVVNATDIETNTADPSIQERSLSLSGSDWPQPHAGWITPTDARVQWPASVPASMRNWNTYACLISDVVAVYTRTVSLEGSSQY